jgi:threonine aldolase
MTDLREQAALRDQCTVFLTGHGPVRPADLLASIPADTVPDRYGDGGVSFYKGIGALAGCCLAGPADVLAEVREWRKRMGGTLQGLWPGAASALTCLRRRLPLMPDYLGHAREIASALRWAPGVRVVPDPPQVSMMHLLLAVTQEGFAAAAGRLAAEQGVWTWPQAMITADPGVQRVELYVGDATRAVPPDRVRDIVTALTAS